MTHKDNVNMNLNQPLLRVVVGCSKAPWTGTHLPLNAPTNSFVSRSWQFEDVHVVYIVKHLGRRQNA